LVKKNKIRLLEGLSSDGLPLLIVHLKCTKFSLNLRNEPGGNVSLFFEPCSSREFGTDLLQPAVLQQCTVFLADLCSGTGLIGQLRCEGPTSSTPSAGAKVLSLLVLIISLSTMCQPSVGGILTESSATTKILIVFVYYVFTRKDLVLSFMYSD
jgi:hypothetical protein